MRVMLTMFCRNPCGNFISKMQIKKSEKKDQHANFGIVIKELLNSFIVN